jgi:hypothetical protein
MVFHTCPICGCSHPVRDARAQVAYGRQLTCSPECESERRRRRRNHPVRPLVAAQPKRAPGVWRRLGAYAARSLHVWVIGTVGADLVRTAAWTRELRPVRER